MLLQRWADHPQLLRQGWVVRAVALPACWRRLKSTGSRRYKNCRWQRLPCGDGNLHPLIPLTDAKQPGVLGIASGTWEADIFASDALIGRRQGITVSTGRSTAVLLDWGCFSPGGILAHNLGNGVRRAI